MKEGTGVFVFSMSRSMLSEFFLIHLQKLMFSDFLSTVACLRILSTFAEMVLKQLLLSVTLV